MCPIAWSELHVYCFEIIILELNTDMMYMFIIMTWQMRWEWSISPGCLHLHLGETSRHIGRNAGYGVQLWDTYMYIGYMRVIGASLSEPHTGQTAFPQCLYVSMYRMSFFKCPPRSNSLNGFDFTKRHSIP